MTWPKRKRRQWKHPGPLRAVEERLGGRVFEGPPRVVLAEISDVLVSLAFSRTRRPTVMADWLHPGAYALPRRIEGPLAQAPGVRAATDAALLAGIDEAVHWPDQLRERALDVSIDLAFAGRCYDARALETAMRWIAAVANAPWPELAMLRSMSEARPPPPRDDLDACFYEPEVHPRQRARVVDFGMLGSATVENDGTIRLHAAGGGECLVPARADGDAVRAALSSIQSQ